MKDEWWALHDAHAVERAILDQREVHRFMHAELVERGLLRKRTLTVYVTTPEGDLLYDRETLALRERGDARAAEERKKIR